MSRISCYGLLIAFILLLESLTFASCNKNTNEKDSSLTEETTQSQTEAPNSEENSKPNYTFSEDYFNAKKANLSKLKKSEYNDVDFSVTENQTKNVKYGGKSAYISDKIYSKSDEKSFSSDAPLFSYTIYNLSGDYIINKNGTFQLEILDGDTWKVIPRPINYNMSSICDPDTKEFHEKFNLFIEYSIRFTPGKYRVVEEYNLLSDENSPIYLTCAEFEMTE